VAHELVGAEADRLLLEPVVADLLHVLPGHDPARARDHGPVEGEEVRPGLVQVDADPQRARHLDLAHLVLEDLVALGALEGELHVLRGERIAVVELEPGPELEVVGLAVGAHRPRLGEARGHRLAGHGLHERVVHRPPGPGGRDEAGDLAGIEYAGELVT